MRGFSVRSSARKKEGSEPGTTFRLGRTIKLGTFHIGSSLTDLLTSALWNRIMIADLGIVAWPVSLLTALRYLLAPLTLWAGHQSDTRPIFGSRRVAYIWIGRLLMLLSLPLLPLSTVAIARDPQSLTGWGSAVISFMLYGVGTLLSGAPFLALVHDSAPYSRRGQAIGVVQFVLVVSFAFLPALYAAAMPEYDPEAYRRLVLMAMAGAAFFWFISVVGEERESPEDETVLRETPPSVVATFKGILGEAHTRRYAIFLGASAFFAFMQDSVLEPFGGEVFGLSAGETTRFNAYWGVGVLAGMLLTLWVTRRWRPDQQVRTTFWGLILLGLPIAGLAVSAMTRSLPLVRPILVFFGLGFGIFTVGGVSLLMAMSRESRAGSYLALWSVVQLLLRGAGIAMGGVLRDLFLAFTGQIAAAYGLVFLVEAVGVLGCTLLLLRVDVSGFVEEREVDLPAGELLTAMD